MEAKGTIQPDVAGIGNYKGIMLCNRPQGQTDMSSADEKKVFTCGVVSEPSGISVSIVGKERVKVKKDKKDSVLAKHKKWLLDLQKAKEQLEQDALQELRRKDELYQRLAEKAQKNRLLSMSDSKVQSDTGTESNEYHNADKHDTANISDMKETSRQTKVSRPAWSLSAKETKEEEKKDNDDEIESLLDFAQNLDYDKYINDIEMKTIISLMQKRINDMEKEINDDEKQEIDIANINTKKENLQKLGNVMSSLSIEESKLPQDRNLLTIAAAKSVLGTEVDLQAVHSTRSVAAMIKSSISVAVDAQPKVYNEPKCVAHEASDGHKTDKIDVSNLPYLHRNPAV